jgi:CelD/BcsL family acetyltransferase involved in cellulose biosynthesis
MQRFSDRLLEIAVIENTEGFAALREEWEDLYRDSSLANPFQSWAWLYSWWEICGRSFKLRLITVRDERLLVGLIPLMLENRWGFRKLLFVGTSSTTYHPRDILVRKGWESQVSEAGRQALEQMDSWHVIDLQDVIPTAAVWSIFQEWERSKTYQHFRQDYREIDVKPWDDLLMSLSKDHRKVARRTIRRAEQDGLSCEMVGVEDADQAARRLVRLHREMWRGRDMKPQHLTSRFESEMVAAARRMTASGLWGISEFWRDGKVIVSQLWAFGDRLTYAYMLGATKEALQRYQVSSLVIWKGINIALDRRSAYLSLGPGMEPYKMRWATRTTPNYRVFLGYRLAIWVPYAACRPLRRTLIRSYRNLRRRAHL